MRISRYLMAAVIVASTLLTACSSNEEKEALEPAELIDFDAEKSFDKLWSEGIGDGQGDLYNRLTPAISGDRIAVAAANGDVELLTIDEGDTVWSVDVDQPLLGGVGFAEGLIVVGAANGEVIALNESDGKVRWKSVVNSEVLAAPQISNELVFVQSFDGRLLALDIHTGEERWSFRSTVPVLTLRGTSTPLIVNDMVLAGFANGKVVAFDAQTGLIRWDVRVAAAKGNSEIERIVDIDGELLYSNKNIFAVSYQGAIAAIDPASGRRLWDREASSYVGMGQGFGNVYVAGDDGTVTAFVNNGQGVRWAQSALARRRLTAPVTLGSYVIVGDYDGYLHALSQVDGHMVARRRVDSDGLRATMLVHNDTLFVYGNSGKLVAYQLQDD